MNVLTTPRWHLEVTSKCTLACSKCPRTLNPKQHNVDLDLEYIEQFFTTELIAKSEGFHFCGNFGDPIYHPEFHKIIKYFIDNDAGPIFITTNGSSRPLSWWNNLCDLLRPIDTLTFSVDGLQDTNHLYRVNSKWDSVYSAMELAVSKNIKSKWKFIVFRHNQHQIEEARTLAEKMGFDFFDVAKSNRYDGANDPLKPDIMWVTSRKRFKDILDPRCVSGVKRSFISATGYYAPCCWYAGQSKLGEHYFSHEDFSIKTHSYEQIMNSSRMEDFRKTLTSFDTADDVCSRFCTKNVSDPSSNVQIDVLRTAF